MIIGMIGLFMMEKGGETIIIQNMGISLGYFIWQKSSNPRFEKVWKDEDAFPW